MTPPAAINPPNTWHWGNLGDLCETASGGTPHRGNSEYFGGHIPWVKSGELPDGPISQTEEFLTEAALANSNAKLLPEGTLLLAMYGATVGKLGVLSIPAATNQAVCSITPGRQLHRDFLFYWLLHTRPMLIEQSFGGAQPNISQTTIRALKVPLAPFSEQRRIATRLREQFAPVETARAAVQAQLDSAALLLAAHLRFFFASPVTQRWPIAKLGDLLRLRKEVVHPRDNPRGAATFVGLEHIQPITGARTGSVPLEMSELTGRKPRFHAGDIVYGYLRPYLNKLWVAEFDGLCSVDQYVYEVNQDRAETDFVAWFMRSPIYLERAPIDTTPGQLPRIRTAEVASVEINLPPLQQQRELLATLKSQITQATTIKDSLAARRTAIENLPASLLREAFAGRI